MHMTQRVELGRIVRCVFVIGISLALAAPVVAHELPPTSGAPSLAAASAGDLIFNSNLTGNYEIYTINVDGTDRYRITDTPNFDEWGPTWSPDGTQIAYATNEYGNWHIALLDAATLTTRQGTFGAANEENPAFSPDGKMLAFEANRGGDLNIYLLNIDTGALMQLTTDPVMDIEPHWWPDGSQVIYSSLMPGEDLNIMRVATADAGRGALVYGTPNLDGFASISPDERYILFHGFRENNWDIYRYDRRTNAEQRLTSHAGKDYLPEWSPDGTMIAWVSDRDGDNEIFVMNADGSSQRQVTVNAVDDTHPDWMPRSRPGGSPGAAASDNPTPPPAASEPPSASDQPPSSAADTSTCRANSTQSVNIRSGPGEGYGVVGTLTSSDPLVVDGYSGRWLRVQLPTGGHGWVAAWIVNQTGPCSSVAYIAVSDAPPAGASSSADQGSTGDRDDPAPADNAQDEASTAQVTFTVDGSPTTHIAPGGCVMVGWQACSAQSVTFLGQAVSNAGQRKMCPTTTTTYTLLVFYADGSSRNYAVTVFVGE